MEQQDAPDAVDATDTHRRSWWQRIRPARPMTAPLRHALQHTRERRPPRSATLGVPTLDQLLGNVGPTAAGEAEATAAAAEQAETELEEDARFGQPGRAFSRTHPFYVGFVGALGVLMAYALVQMVAQLSQVITLLVVSLFLALGLEPLVERLERQGFPRVGAISLVFLGVLVVVAGFVAAVVPILVRQTAELATEVPQYLEDLQNSRWFIDLDARFNVVGRITEELQKLASGERVTALFGGVFGAGKAVLSGVFSTLTVLVLTLYFLASLRGTKAAAYRMVPRSRRQRVQLLGDEISRRIGGYVMGQIGIATINAVCSYVMMLIVGIPYALALAVVVGLFGLIPLVGATLGAIVVVVVALFGSVTDALVVAVYYVAYQQFENYVIAPRIMARTVSVPGAVTLVAALAGGSLLGVLGALIAIPLAAGVLLVIQEVLMPRQDRT